MAQSNRKPEEFERPFTETEELRLLKSKAVAIDPPPAGAIGIQELLKRFERFAEVDELIDPPGNQAVGVRDLLQKLKSLTEAGYFSAPYAEEPTER